MSAESWPCITGAINECMGACLAFEAFHSEMLALCMGDTVIDELMKREPEHRVLLDRVAAAGKAMRIALASVPR